MLTAQLSVVAAASGSSSSPSDSEAPRKPTAAAANSAPEAMPISEDFSLQPSKKARSGLLLPFSEISSTPMVPITMATAPPVRSEEHTSALQSLMRISYAVFCLTQKLKHHND